MKLWKLNANIAVRPEKIIGFTRSDSGVYVEYEVDGYAELCPKEAHSEVWELVYKVFPDLEDKNNPKGIAVKQKSGYDDISF